VYAKPVVYADVASDDSSAIQHHRGGFGPDFIASEEMEAMLLKKTRILHIKYDLEYAEVFYTYLTFWGYHFC
jgi:hypothetical protein